MHGKYIKSINMYDKYVSRVGHGKVKTKYSE